MEKIKDDNSKQRILDAATCLFAQKGYEGTSIRQICNTARANICMISYYWGGKKELYNGIIDDLILRQTQYAKTFIDFDKKIETMNKQEQVSLLMKIIDKFIEFFYSGNISKDLIIFLLKAQQTECFIEKSPAITYLRNLIAAIFDKDVNDREIIFKTVFIISQVNSPRILPAFSLNLLGQDDFIQEDINIIKENVKFYINALLKEANIV